VWRRSIRMVVPRPFFDPTAAAAAGWSSLSEPLSHGLQSWADTFASSAGGPGPVPPAAEPMRTSILPRHGPDPQVRLTPSTPNTRTLHMSPFGPFLTLQGRPEFRANEPVTHCLDRRAEWSIWNPFGSDRRDPNTLAPNRIEARTTPLRPSRTSTSS
jgi:hypothetical protein